MGWIVSRLRGLVWGSDVWVVVVFGLWMMEKKFKIKKKKK